MSRIEELIREHCPDGVEHHRLADVARVVAGLSGKSKADFTGGNARYVSYKNAFANLAVDQTMRDFVDVREGERQNRLHEGDVVFTGSSESVDEVGMSSVVATEPDEPLYLNSFCFALRFDDHDLLLPGFSKYLFRSEALRRQIRASGSGVTRINISKERFLKTRIPVPPPEVQREIVRILDAFTELEAELEAELAAELKARRQLHEHAQKRVLKDISELNARQMALRDVGTWYGGGTPAKARREYWDKGTIPWISPKDMGSSSVDTTEDHITDAAVAESATKLVPGGSVAIVVRSSILDHTLPVAFVRRPSALNQDMKAVVAGPGIAPRYLFQALSAVRADLLRTVRRPGGSVASLESRRLWEYEIPIPELRDQERAVELLDKLDALVNDISIGLPAELAARRKQYEYYRDKLLTFPEAS